MKTYFKLFLTICLLLMLFSCSNEDQSVHQLESMIIENRAQSNAFISFGLDFPIGTEILIEGNTLTYNLPEPYYILGIDDLGNYYMSQPGGEGGVTCTCNSGSGGCSPTKIKGKYGCAMSSCSNCSKSFTTPDHDDVVLKNAIIIDPEMSGFIQNLDDLDGKKLVPSEFMSSNEMQSLFQFIEGEVDNIDSQNKIEIPLLAYGHVVILRIPKEEDNTSLRFINQNNQDEISPGFPDEGGISCSCNSDGSCPKDWNVIATWCDATNCQSCTLSGIIKDKNGNKAILSSDTNGVISISIQ